MTTITILNSLGLVQLFGTLCFFAWYLDLKGHKRMNHVSDPRFQRLRKMAHRILLAGVVSFVIVVVIGKWF